MGSGKLLLDSQGLHYGVAWASCVLPELCNAKYEPNAEKFVGPSTKNKTSSIHTITRYIFVMWMSKLFMPLVEETAGAA